MKLSWLFSIALLSYVSADNLMQSKEWWQTAVIYQIYPRSFMDSNGDGVGDLNGITEKLDHIKEAGADAVWLSPIFESPMYDFGYDISNFKKIQPEYGTMDDFRALTEKAKGLGLHIILDFVPNHSSNESDWFRLSANRTKGYENYFVWADGKPDPQNPGKFLPPNNWISHFRKSAWEFNKERGQFYLHQFVIGQPDLNYREPAIVEEMKNGNHDNSRVASRNGIEKADGFNMLALLLPGVALTYQGEELAMTDGFVSWEDTKDPQACNTDDPINYYKASRDPERTPFQWDNTLNAGFSTGSKTWLPVASNYKEVNLEAQKKAEKSHYKFYKDLTSLRKTAPVIYGDLEIKAISNEVLAFTRSSPDKKIVIAVLNLSGNQQTVDLSMFRYLPETLTVYASSLDSALGKGTKVKTNQAVFSPYDAVVLTCVAK